MEQWRAELYHYGVPGMKWGEHKKYKKDEKGKSTGIRRVASGVTSVASGAGNAIRKAKARAGVASLTLALRGVKPSIRVTPRKSAQAKPGPRLTPRSGRNEFANGYLDSTLKIIRNTKFWHDLKLPTNNTLTNAPLQMVKGDRSASYLIQDSAKRIGMLRDELDRLARVRAGNAAKNPVPDKEETLSKYKAGVDKMVKRLDNNDKSDQKTGSVRKPKEKPSVKGTKAKTKRKGR